MKTVTTLSSRKTTAVLLALEALLVTIPFFMLGSAFNFPDILREPAEKAFRLFNANKPTIVTGYYLFVLSSLIYAPLSYYLVKTYRHVSSDHLQRFFIGAGLATMIFQTIGFIRWIFFMPWLTEVYMSQPAQRDTVSLLFETLNHYAGMSVGEHLGFIAMGSWMILLGCMLLQSKLHHAGMGYSGIAIGLLLIISTAEQFGGAAAPVFGLLNLIANITWTFWMLTLAVLVAKGRETNIQASTRLERTPQLVLEEVR